MTGQVISLRIFLKEKYEARGYIRITVKAKYKLGKTSNIELEDREINTLINMRYHLLTNNRFSKDLVRFIYSTSAVKEYLTYIVPPPYISFYLTNLVDRISELRNDLEKIFNHFKPKEIDFSLKITTRKPKIFLGEVVGRVIRIIVDEFSNMSNWSELRRRLSRYSGFSEVDLDKILDSWRKGVSDIVRAAINYLNVLDYRTEEFLSGLKIGLGVSDDLGLKRVMKMFINFAKGVLNGKEVGDSLMFLSNLLEIEEKAEEVSYEKGSAKDCILTGIKTGRKGDFIKCIKKFGRDIVLEIFRDILMNENIDKDRVLAAILIVSDVLKMGYPSLKKFLQDINISDKTLAGSFLRALKLIDEKEVAYFEAIVGRLLDKISDFSYSAELRSFPYRILVAKSYELLAHLYKYLGVEERSKVFKEMSKRFGVR